MVGDVKDMSTNGDAFDGKLFTQFPAEQQYPANDKLQGHLLEQYKLYVEMADRISARRQSANSYFLTINTVLLGFTGYVTPKDSSNYLWLLGLAGIALCYSWYRLIRSYRDLNNAKFKVIHAIEKRLPLSPYDAEWEAMGQGKNPRLYKPFTHIETSVPWVFLMLHAFNVFRTLLWGNVCL
jgi:hypothetical protein